MTEKALQMIQYNCKHLFCKACTTNWITVKVDEGYTNIPCLDKACTHEINLKNIIELDNRLYKQIEKNMLTKYLLSLKDSIICPICNLVCISNGDCTNAECQNCNNLFCSMCFQSGHPNLTCEEAQNNLNETEKLKYNNFKLSIKYIAQVARICPSCGAKIERDGGCSHMRCSICKFEFCYLCLQKYKGRHVATDAVACTC